jgi:hypothetical protein
MMFFLHEGRPGPLFSRPGNGRAGEVVARRSPIRLGLLIVALLFSLMVCSQAQITSPTGTTTTGQTSQYPVNSVQWWIAQLVPLSTIDNVARQITPLFYAIGALLIVFGFWGRLGSSHSKASTVIWVVVLMVAMGSSVWWLGVVQQMVASLVTSISSLSGTGSMVATGQQVGNNQTTTVISFAPMAQALAVYTQGTWSTSSPSMGLNLGADLQLLGNYIARLVVIGLILLTAITAVCIMTIMSTLQQLIVILSQPFLPLFVGMLALDSTRGNAHNFFKQLIGVVAWPVGWVLVFMGAAAALGQLPSPNWAGDIGQLIMVFLQTFVVCLWIGVGVITVPRLVSWLVVKGDNFAAGMVGAATSVAGQTVTNMMSAGGGVAGAGLGAGLGMGSFGAQAGAAIGSGLANASPISGITQGIEGGTGVSSTTPNAASRGAADAAVQRIVRPMQQAEDSQRSRSSQGGNGERR